MEFLKRYIDMIHIKAEIRKQTRPEGNTVDLYINGLKEEIDEVKHELRQSNHVYLEDELGDILWDYMNTLYYLEQEGMITSRENVLSRSMKKYQERVTGQKESVSRKEVKSIQKKKLEEEHKSYYSESHTRLNKSNVRLTK